MYIDICIYMHIYRFVECTLYVRLICFVCKHQMGICCLLLTYRYLLCSFHTHTVTCLFDSGYDLR